MKKLLTLSVFLLLFSNVDAQTTYYHGNFVKYTMTQNGSDTFRYNIVCDTQKQSLCAAITEPIGFDPGKIELFEEKINHEVFRFKELLEPVSKVSYDEMVEYRFAIRGLIR